MKEYNGLYNWHRSPKKSVNINSLLTYEVEKELLKAVNQKLKTEIIYNGGSEPRVKRIIEPHRLFERLGDQYIESYCYLRLDFRTFRIDRIESIEVLNLPHEKEPTSKPQHFSTNISKSRPTTSRGIPYWVWIVGFFLLLYFCSKLN
jgi:predicted DNA-binding transcriptional regulator YafY